MLARHLARLEASFTRERAGRRIASSSAIIPMTTRSSTSVNAREEVIAIDRPRLIRNVRFTITYPAQPDLPCGRRPRHLTTGTVHGKQEVKMDGALGGFRGVWESA